MIYEKIRKIYSVVFSDLYGSGSAKIAISLLAGGLRCRSISQTAKKFAEKLN